MVVYILHYRWENEDNSGAEVLGVYAEDNLAEAQAEMRDLAAKRKNWRRMLSGRMTIPVRNQWLYF